MDTQGPVAQAARKQTGKDIKKIYETVLAVWPGANFVLRVERHLAFANKVAPEVYERVCIPRTKKQNAKNARRLSDGQYLFLPESAEIEKVLGRPRPSML